MIEKWAEKYSPLISPLEDSEALKLVTQRGFGITIFKNFQGVAKQRHSCSHMVFDRLQAEIWTRDLLLTSWRSRFIAMTSKNFVPFPVVHILWKRDRNGQINSREGAWDKLKCNRQNCKVKQFWLLPFWAGTAQLWTISTDSQTLGYPAVWSTVCLAGNAHRQWWLLMPTLGYNVKKPTKNNNAMCET